MNEYFQKQYALVRHSRGVLFDFLAGKMGDAGVVAPVAAYMDKSVRDLLVHCAGCYLNWLGYLALRQPLASISGATMSELRGLYDRVDETMGLFLHRFSNAMDERFTGVHDSGWTVNVTPQELFTHVTTHEFHHKGQIVLMARMLGFVPPDTDVSNAFPEQPPE